MHGIYKSINYNLKNQINKRLKYKVVLKLYKSVICIQNDTLKNKEIKMLSFVTRCHLVVCH